MTSETVPGKHCHDSNGGIEPAASVCDCSSGGEDDALSETNRLAYVITLCLSGLILSLGLMLFSPFFEPIAWAIILVLFFYPVYERLCGIFHNNTVAASLVMCVLIVAFIVIPVFGLMASLSTEVMRVFSEVQEYLQRGDFFVVPDESRHPLLHKLTLNLIASFDGHEDTVRNSIMDFSRAAGQFFFRQGTVIFKNAVSIVFKAALMVVTLFYLFTDGPGWLREFRNLLPVRRHVAEKFINLTADVLSATLHGNLLTGAIQGALGIFILWSLDFSAPLLWGTVLGMGTFIPIVGTAIVWVPATLYLFISGAYLKGTILLAFSLLVISQIDYFLRPLLISGKTQLHSMFLFFSILGGLQTFGFLGLILGPILVALCVSILEVYKQIVRHA